MYNRLNNQAERTEYRNSIISRYPTGKVTEYAGGALTVLTYEASVNGAPCVYAWRGTAGKPYAHYSFRAAAERESWIASEVRAQEKRNARKAERAEAKKAKAAAPKDENAPHFEAGKIYGYTWDAEGTYYDEIEIVSRSAQYVTFYQLRRGERDGDPMRKKIEYNGNPDSWAYGEAIWIDCISFCKAADVAPTEEEKEAARLAEEAQREAEAAARREAAEAEAKEIERIKAAYPHSPNTPAVVVEWVEGCECTSKALTAEPLSVEAFDRITEMMDNSRHNDENFLGYDKLKFRLVGTRANGEPLEYVDRYDLGDGYGGFFKFLRACKNKANHDLADYLEQYTVAGHITVNTAVITDFLELKKAARGRGKRAREEADRQSLADMATEIDMMTVEQVERGVDIAMGLDFGGDKEARENIVKFFLNSLMRQGKKADAFRIWNKCKDELTA